MTRNLYVGRVLLALVPFLTISSAAQATLATWNRVFISTTGNDANNCSDPATPCRTFAGAQAQTNAGGEIIAMATGGYGQLNITQSVTINGPVGVVIFSNYPVSVNAPGATVVLRGLTIDGTGTATGHGINVASVGNLHIESCVITGFPVAYGPGPLPGSPGPLIGGNGIHFASPGNLYVKDTIARGNGAVGIWVAPSSGTALASVDHCRLEQNSYGLYTSGGNGGAARVTIRDSVVSGNGQEGLHTDTAGELNAEQCVITNNRIGAYGSGTALRLSYCTVTDNIYVGVFGSSIISRGNNTVEANGVGQNGDGSFTGSYSAK
jgi:hypothetical protein